MAQQNFTKEKSAFSEGAKGTDLTSNGAKATRYTLAQIVGNFKKNFLTRPIEIVPGLQWNQYETVKRIYLYTHGHFETGDTDEQGNPKYFYDLVTYRADQAKKNVDFDTKDVYIKSEGGETNYLKSWMLRKEYTGYAKSSHFGKKLNEVSDDIAPWGTVVWKHSADEEIIHQVELINIVNEPGAKSLKDSSLFLERHLMTQKDMRDMTLWDQTMVDQIIKDNKTVAKNSFMTPLGAKKAFSNTQVDDLTPFYEVFEVWGWVPEVVIPEFKDGDVKKYRYVQAMVNGVDDGNSERKLYIKETDPSNFPYAEVHFRRKKGRWLGVGYTESLFSLTERANELTNRFYQGLRIGSMHLYQTRNKGFVRNILTDLEDGDIIETPHELTAIPTEIRAFSQYQGELKAIEEQADKICNSYEIVTGDNMPSGTPFRLGTLQLGSAVKFFDYVKQNIGLFVEYAFNEWVLPDFAKQMNRPHILELLGDAADLERYFTLCKRIKQYDAIKRYIMANSQLPTSEEIQTISSLIEDQYANMPKEIQIESNYYSDQKYSLKVVTTGENEAKSRDLESMTTLIQTLIANPAALQDDRIMKLIGIVTETSGALSPLDLNLLSNTPTNPSLNPANQGGAGSQGANAALPGAPTGGGGPNVPAMALPANSAVAAAR